jgi:hypothetical protein
MNPAPGILAPGRSGVGCFVFIGLALALATGWPADGETASEPAVITIHLAPDGDDSWSGLRPRPGSGDGPVATPAGALAAARRARAASAGPVGVNVEIQAGRYELDSPLTFQAGDGGTPAHPVEWRARRGDRVIFSGGRRLPRRLLRSVEDPEVAARLPAAAHGRVLEVDLVAAGVTDAGTFSGSGNRLEVFAPGGVPLPIARWPDDDFATIGTLLGDRPMTDGGLPGNSVGYFTTESADTDRLTRWQAEPDGWLAGYFFWDWSDSRQRIRAVDPTAASIELEPPHTTYREGQRFYAFNMLCELDRPGEWCVDRQRGALFIWPPDGWSVDADDPESDLVVSLLDRLIEVDGAEHLTFRGLVLEGTRDALVRIRGGAGVRIGGCLLRSAGGWGVLVDGGQGHAVVGCDLHDLGEGGVKLVGGDRAGLVPAGHAAVNNHVHHYARLHRTYRPAVEVQGVGHRVAHNHIHDAPHNGILLGGNDHLIELNRIHDVCQETGDVGAFYMGRDWTMRGTVVRHNFISDLTGPGRLGAMGIYLDDCASGITVFGNLLVRAGRAVLVGGGRDNVVDSNLFVDGTPAVEVDARGLGWFAPTVAPDGWMRQRLDEMPWREPPWTIRYPGLTTLLDEVPEAPRNNSIRRNVSVGGEWARIEDAAADSVVIEHNLVDVDPGFVDPEAGDWRLRPDSPAWRIGFERIPLERIGLQPDAWRTEIPAE